MTIPFDRFRNSLPPRKPLRLSLSAPTHRRLEALRERIESRFRIRFATEELLEYLCEKALERLEDWERRTR